MRQSSRRQTKDVFDEHSYVGDVVFSYVPSRPRELHPESLTDACLSLSTHTARATPEGCRLPSEPRVPPVARASGAVRRKGEKIDDLSSLAPVFKSVCGDSRGFDNGVRDVVHVLPAAKKHALMKAHGLLDEPVRCRTVVVCLVGGEFLLRIDSAIGF
jgi:hypothetical protein